VQSQPTTLLIFCKQPRLYHGKQRLAAVVGADKALMIAQALLKCAIEDAKAWSGPVVLSPSHPDQQEWAQSILPQASVVPQPEGNLGERIRVVDSLLRKRGHSNILIIGTDAPVLSNTHFTEVNRLLNESDVVMSAASDGGVTIMAATQPWPEISDLPWSTERLNESLYDRCQSAGHKVSYIRPSYDIDHEKDLYKLLIDLENDHRPARQKLLALTKEILSKDESYA